MNILNCYINFKKKYLCECVNIIYDKRDVKIDKFIEEFIDTYIKTYYFHVLQTLDEEDVSIYNYHVITKELYGKKLELLYELDNDKDKYSDVIDDLYEIITRVVKLNYSNDISVDNVNKIFAHISDEKKDSVLKKVKVSFEKEEKFIDKLGCDDFNLTYHLYKNQNSKFFVSLNSNIKQLENNYSHRTISKNLNKDKISYNKVETILNLLNIDLLKKIRKSEPIDYYFICIDEYLIDNKDMLLSLLDIIDNEHVREHIVLLINYNYYLNHKRILNIADIKYSFAVLLDMSHVRATELKLENVEAIKIFDYVVVDKIKSQDYETILEYESMTGKEIFINELLTDKE